MKKSEFTQLTQIIEHLVAKEVRKQLPVVISEVFQNMMGKQIVSEQQKPLAPSVPVKKESVKEQIEQDDMKASLRELFAGVTKTGVTIPVEQEVDAPPAPAPKQSKQYTKNPIFNKILNETTSDLRAREGLVGMAAFQGGYSPMPGAVAMAASSVSPSRSEMEMAMGEEAPSYMKNAPVMPGTGPSVPVASIPMGRPPVLVEGQESSHAPMAAIPEGISALDVARAGMTPAPVAEALTNYDRMRAVLAASKKRR